MTNTLPKSRCTFPFQVQTVGRGISTNMINVKAGLHQSAVLSHLKSHSISLKGVNHIPGLEIKHDKNLLEQES